MKNNQPNYRRIYSDILNKHPEKKAECHPLLKKENLSVLDIIELNKIIFSNGIDLINSINSKPLKVKILKQENDPELENTGSDG